MLFRFETERLGNGVNCIVTLKSDIGENPYRTNFFAETDLDMVEGLSYFTNTHAVFLHSALDFYKAPDHIIRKAVDRLEWLVRGGWMRAECFVDNFEEGIEEVVEEAARELDCSGFCQIYADNHPYAFYKKEETKVEMEFETSDYCAYEPVKVWYNPPYTTVEFDDGEKITTKCQDGDTFSKVAGFAICCLKKEFEGWTGVKNVIEKCEYRANRKKLLRKAQKEARKVSNEYARKQKEEIKKQRHEALVRKFYEERKAKDEALQRFYEHEAKRNEMAPTATDRSKYSHWANQITDMALNSASDKELSDAIRKSMNAIDAEKEDKQ